ncbi:MAG: hypothetical protein ABWZ76_08450 [Acidimicrobiales bacterium]
MSRSMVGIAATDHASTSFGDRVNERRGLGVWLVVSHSRARPGAEDREGSMKRIAAMVCTVLLTGTALATPAAAAGPYCGQRWGSLPEIATAGSTGEVVNVRAGRHACFDRLVLDVEGHLGGYFVQYVDVVRHDGSGDPVPLRGGARLQVTATAPAAPTDAIFLSTGELVDVSRYRTFRQVAWAGTFEGNTTIGLGVRARLPFRVFILRGPGDTSRLVVDVGHRW